MSWHRDDQSIWEEMSQASTARQVRLPPAHESTIRSVPHGLPMCAVCHKEIALVDLPPRSKRGERPHHVECAGGKAG